MKINMGNKETTNRSSSISDKSSKDEITNHI